VPTSPSPDVLVALGHAVRSLRLERGFSQERLAELSSLSARYISDVERGTRNVGMVNVDRLARALSVDLPTFMAGVEAERRR
jgi:transcriptional regulator with XRE-family HTH domain